MLNQPMNSASRFVYGPLYWEPVVLSVGSGPFTYQLHCQVRINDYSTSNFTGFRVDPIKGKFYAVMLDNTLGEFDTVDEAKRFVEATYELKDNG